MTDGAAVRDGATTCALAATTLVTAVAMCRVFAGWDFLPPLLVVGAAAHAASTGLRLLRLPGLVALPVASAIVGVVVSVVCLPGTQWAGVVPTATTWQIARAQLADAWTAAGLVVPPVPSTAGFGLAAALAIGFSAVAADAFAMRARGHVEALVPSGVVFIVVAALGLDRLRVATAVAWLLSALLVVVLARAGESAAAPGWIVRRPGRAWRSRVVAGTVLALAAAGLGGFLGPRLPGAGADALLDPDLLDGEGSVTVSPLVDIRGRLSDRSDTVLFTVLSDRPQYWRLSGLPVFDGNTWTLPDDLVEEAGGDLSPPRPDGRELVQGYRIEQLGGLLLPAASDPSELRSTDVDLYYAVDTATLLTDDEVRAGVEYEIVSSTPEPPLERLLTATSDDPPDASDLALPRGWDQALTDQARMVVRGASSPYETARALQDWFRSDFVYDLQVPPGHSVDAIEVFLARRRGYCEQFAGTFAALARSLGLPARVAVGFTSGEVGADGRYRVRSRHAHAWPEVWFDGVGWVLFEPTPGRGAPGAEGHTGVPAAQDDSASEPTAGGTAGPTTTTPSGPSPTASPPSITLPDKPTGGTAASTDEGTGAGPWVFGAVLVLAGWMVGMPAAVRRRGARRSGEDRVVQLWSAALARLRLSGLEIDPSLTPIETAAHVARVTGIDRHELDELARAATAAAYSDTPLDPATVERCTVIGRHLLSATGDTMSRRGKILMRIDPRTAAQVTA